MIHFGLYSIPAGVWNGVPAGRSPLSEWIQMQGNWPHGIPAEEYKTLLAEFNPTNFNADEWIRDMVGAGMRYMVITSKHHDGFALWPSKVSDYNVVDATPFGRDILGELKAACDKYGAKLGFYYSHWLDWEHQYGGRPHEEEFHSEPRWPQPSQEEFEIYWQEKCLPQVRELIDNYDPCLFWFDTWARNSTEWINEHRMDELIGLIREKSPNCLINSRLGTWGHSKGHAAVDYVSTQDNEHPDWHIEQPWETSGTMNHSFAYHQLDFNWRSTHELLKRLIGNAARGGNYHLNVGPMDDGRFQPAVIRRLREMGAWVEINGEALYGTTAYAYDQPEWGAITTRALDDGGTRLYLHIFDPKAQETVVIPDVKTQPTAAKIIETRQPITTESGAEGLTVKIPAEAAAIGIPVIAVDLPTE